MSSNTTAGSYAEQPGPAGLAGELARRHELLADALQASGAGCLVATRDQTVTYLTGYTTTTWKSHSRPIVAVLTAAGRLRVLAPETEADSARARIPTADVRTYVALEPPGPGAALPDGVIQFAPAAARALEGIIEDAGHALVAVDGLDAAWPPVGQPARLIPALAGRLRDASSMVWQARLRKSGWELDRMRAASRVLERAYARLTAQLRPGMTEREIARRFVIAQWEEGAHDVGQLGVVAGPSRGLFGAPTERAWGQDELLYVDGCAIVDGYWSDYCRTFAAGPPAPAQRDGYARARAGLQAALATPAGAAGTTAATAGDVGRCMAQAMGIGPADVGFGRFGHGIGLHAPEPPSLHPADTTALELGFTLCIEPAVAHEGVNFVLEEEHALSDAGWERLSPAAPAEIVRI
jgi:Xaa-Pro aminopeptidase